MYSVWSSNFAFSSFAIHQWKGDIGRIVAIFVHKNNTHFRSIAKVLYSGNIYLVNTRYSYTKKITLKKVVRFAKNTIITNTYF